LRIYLACTVRGDRGAVAALRELVHDLETGGHTVLTKHLLEDNIETSESALTERQVFDRDIAWLDACDLLIADASGSSFGVGFEVGYVLGRSDRTQQRVLLLYRADRRDVISRLIVGLTHPHCDLIAYADAASLVESVSRQVPPLGR